nr:MAG TPA: KilA protein [Caudoviricetes sp.]
MNAIQSFSFNDTPVSFRDDGYLNATAIATYFGKQPRDYLKSEQTQQYIAALADFLSTKRKILVKENQIVIVKNGGNNRGTWLHPKLAVHFARWLDPKFAVWCDEQIEALLNGKVSDGLPAKTTADDRTPLRQAVAALVGRKGIDYSTAYGMIHQRFGVEAIEDLPREKLPEAVAYVHALTLHTGLVGEVLDREPLPAPQPALLDGLDIERFAVTVYYGAWALEMLNEVALPLRQLGHPKATTMHTLWAESRGFLRHNVQALRRILPALEPDRAAHVRGTLDRLQRLNARFI